MTSAAERAPAPVRTRSLHRVLGAAFGLAMAIGATIGGGILRTPGDVAHQVPNAALFMAVWAFGGLNTLLGAPAYAELGAMIGRSGGIYTFAHRAMGDSVGFFLGFSDFLNWCLAPASLLLVISEYLGALVPALAGHQMITAFVILVLLIAMQLRGVLWGGRFTEITSLLKTIALLALVAAAFFLPHTPVAPGTGAHPTLPNGFALLAALALAMQGVVFTYDSYYAVVYCSEEVTNPDREIPRSIFRGLFLIIAVYLLVNAMYITIVPIERMAGDPFVGATVARALFARSGDTLIRVIMIVSILGTVNAELLSAPRILLAMSRDGLFPKRALEVNEGGSPSVASIISLVAVTGFLFLGSSSLAINVDTIFIIVGYVMVFTSLFVLRRREPDARRPYRAFGYPIVPGLALLIAVTLLGTLVVADVKSSAITLGLLVLSWPVSKLVKRSVRGEA